MDSERIDPILKSRIRDDFTGRGAAKAESDPAGDEPDGE